MPPTQGGAKQSRSLLKAVSHQQKQSFIIMNEGAGDLLFTMPFPWVVESSLCRKWPEYEQAVEVKRKKDVSLLQVHRACLNNLVIMDFLKSHVKEKSGLPNVGWGL